MEVDDFQKCHVCACALTAPFIRCMDCKPNAEMCLQCFAKGTEFGQHENNHTYTICKKDFPLFENAWTAEEEERLLQLIHDSGYGNWKDISQQMKNKTSTECEKHYNSYYIENPHPSLPKFPEADINYFPSPIVFKLSEDPPRPAEGSPMFMDMAGYMAARGDFGIEHNNYAELELHHIDFDTEEEDPLEEELKLAVIDIYNQCLKERRRRKRIIRDYGLINYRKVNNMNTKYDRAIHHLVNGLRVFAHIVTPIEADLFLESLNYAQELRNDIRKLKEYRQNGLTRFRQMKTYCQLKLRRQLTQQRRTLFKAVVSHIEDETCQSWLNRQAALDNISKGISLPLPTVPRKPAPPLDLSGLPGHEKLTDSEKELCASARILPEAFCNFKKQLVSECQRLGSLKLSQARPLIKIDVNKTRRIYDHLIQEGHINKDPF